MVALPKAWVKENGITAESFVKICLYHHPVKEKLEVMKELGERIEVVGKNGEIRYGKAVGFVKNFVMLDSGQAIDLDWISEIKIVELPSKFSNIEDDGAQSISASDCPLETDDELGEVAEIVEEPSDAEVEDMSRCAEENNTEEQKLLEDEGE